MKTIPNPAYEDAPWAIGITGLDVTPEEYETYKLPRFNIQPPPNLWSMKDEDRNKWIEENQVPPYIEVP